MSIYIYIYIHKHTHTHHIYIYIHAKYKFSTTRHRIPGGLVYLWAVSGTALCKLDTEGGRVNSMAVNPGNIGQLLLAQENGYVTVWSQR